MFLNHPDYSIENMNKGKEGLSPIIKYAAIFFLSLIFVSKGFAQWINNPSENTRLVIDGSDPVDINAVRDLRGGAFIFWQDKKSGIMSEVFFIHVNNNGKVTLRADGKKVADLVGPEESPVAASSLPNTAVVVWKDLTLANSGNLLAQRVSNTGNYLWPSHGVEITTGNSAISNYSVSSGVGGNVFIAYVSRSTGTVPRYNLEIQKLNHEGKLLLDRDSTVIYSSVDRNGFTSLVPDNNGGVYLLWLQYHNNNSTLMAQHVDSSGHSLWGKNPVKISGNKDNVILYTAERMDFPAVYVAWQSQKNDKDIYHQIITAKGKNLWISGGRLATPNTGKQINPNAVVSDSSVILSWTKDSGTDKDIYAQKFDIQGKTVWGRLPIPLIQYQGDQFGQKIISDGKGGAVVAWIDRRNDSTYADIYAQRIDSKGKKLWDSLGLKVGSNFNTLKSYLSLVTDENGGAIAIFKNKRGNEDDIYGQRIFSSGTYASQIVGFNAGLTGDSVKVSWYSANESGNIKYTVERTGQIDNDSTDWKTVGFVYSNGQPGINQYHYYDIPDTTGTLYYRVLQSDSVSQTQSSDIVRLNYFGSSSNVIVAQNVPNPFADSTVISFYLPDSGNVKVEFYNSHIEKINEINQAFPSGENNITFSAKGLNPGIYFYRFTVNSFVGVKKMVIIR